MKLALTGATGFIGRHATARLVADGHEVFQLTRHSEASSCNRRFDLADPTTFEPAVSGVDVVVHAAAYLPKSYADPGEARACLESNALATLALLEAAVRAGVSSFVFLSTNVYQRSDQPLVEAAAAYPSAQATYYLTSKLCGEIWVSHFDTTQKLRTVSLRLASVVGPGLARGVVPTFTDSLLAGRPIQVVDGGRFRSDLVDVGDVAAAISAASVRDVHGLFNIGSGTTSSMLEVAENLLTLTGANPSLLTVAPSSGVSSHGFPALDIGRARWELDYQPRSLRESLARYVASRRG